MPGASTDALVLKLKKNNRLDQDDVLAIEQLPIKTKRIAAHHYFVREGERPSESCPLIEGFAFRSKLTPDGIRQILSIHIPGDILTFKACTCMSWIMT
jgi:CRP-like cAMP-binding protein